MPRQTRHKISLRVHDALRDDVYRDVARIHWKDRGPLKLGAIAKVGVEGKRGRYLAIRGLGDDRRGLILLDHVTRGEMVLDENATYEFTLEGTNAFEKVKWACSASDPGARIAAWIALWSVLLGIFGVILGIVGVVFSAYPIVAQWAR